MLFIKCLNKIVEKITHMQSIILLLGSNLGETKQNLVIASQLISKKVGKIDRSSDFYETAAWGKTDQADFLNQVLILKTELEPLELLAQLQAIELEMGRVRFEKWGARLIDIDILFYGEQVLDLPDLKVPHPFIQERRFTLMPLVELVPDMIHSVLKVSMKDLLDACPDKLSAKRLDKSEA